MKNKFCYLIVLVLLCSCDNNVNKTAREEAGFKGLVKKVLSIDYEAIDKFGEGKIVTGKPESFGAYMEEYDTLGNVISHTDYYLNNKYISSEAIFDKNGIELKYTAYESNGDIDFEFLYNDKGQQISWISYDDGKLKHSMKYEYNDKGDKIKEIDLLEGDVQNIQIKYNELGKKTWLKDDFRTITYEYENELLKKETSTFQVGYIYRSVDVTNYKYNSKGQLIEELSYDNGKLKKNERYEYNENNQKVKYVIERDGKVECKFYKYDDFGRLIDVLETDGENPDNSVVKGRNKLFYANNNAAEAYRKQFWDETGKLKYDNYDMCFLMSEDTLSVVSFNIDNEITNIKRFMKKGENLHRINYRTDCDPDVINYNYVSGLLISKTDESGHTTNYEYEKDELIKKTEETFNGKTITLYEDQLPISQTKYDNNNRIEWSETIEYDGDLRNGKTTRTIKNKDNEEVVETTYKNGVVVQRRDFSKGVTLISDYTYNDNGDLIEVKCTDGSSRKYSYEYDPFNNWLKRTCITQNGTTKITERSIEYF